MRQGTKVGGHVGGSWWLAWAVWAEGVFNTYEVVVESVKVMQCCFNTAAFQEGGGVKALDHQAYIWCLAAVMLYPLGCRSLNNLQCPNTFGTGISNNLLSMPGLSLWQSLS